jgi:hypothetical protein
MKVLYYIRHLFGTLLRAIHGVVDRERKANQKDDVYNKALSFCDQWKSLAEQPKGTEAPRRLNFLQWAEDPEHWIDMIVSGGGRRSSRRRCEEEEEEEVVEQLKQQQEHHQEEHHQEEHHQEEQQQQQQQRQ